MASHAPNRTLTRSCHHAVDHDCAVAGRTHNPQMTLFRSGASAIDPETGNPVLA